MVSTDYECHMTDYEFLAKDNRTSNQTLNGKYEHTLALVGETVFFLRIMK
jgi:hypothetical protein